MQYLNSFIMKILSSLLHKKSSKYSPYICFDFLHYSVDNLHWTSKMFVVEMRRIELLTPCLQGRCSPSWATPPNFHWYFVKTASAYSCIAFVVFPGLNENCSLKDHPFNWTLITLSIYLVSFNFVQIVSIGDCRVLWYAIEPITISCAKFGGPKWTRTTDLTLIRRAL